MTDNTKKLLADDGELEIDGVVEIGSPGAYLSTLKNKLNISGKAYVINESESLANYAQNFDWSKPFSRFHSYDQFIELNDYAPIPEDEIPTASVDLVVCYPGFHHIAPEDFGPFVASINRILRPGGKLILREHDARDAKSYAQAAAAHSVFNAIADGLTFEEEQDEIREFKPIDEYIELIKAEGFEVLNERRLIQEGDSTLNTLVGFTIPLTVDIETIEEVNNADTLE